MKKYLLALAGSSLLVFTATAQNATATASSSDSKFSLGPVIGVGWAGISNLSDTKGRGGANFGLAMVYSAAEHFGIGADVKYTFEGAKQEVSINSTTTTVLTQLNYIRIPLKAIYFFNRYGNSIRPKLFAGPNFGFLANAKTEINGNKQDIDDIKSFDLGLTIGGGANFRLAPKTWLNLDLSYMQGLTNIDKTGTEDHKNMHLFLNLGVNFGL